MIQTLHIFFGTFDLAFDYVWHGFLFAYACWIVFVAVMGLSKAKIAGTLKLPAKVLGYPLLFVGLVMDALVNWFVFSLIVLDFPKELLTTSHLNSIIARGSGWRRSIALWICKNLLDSFDPHAPHCKCEPAELSPPEAP